mmetsp:Transcript_49796/g.60204  ORF Transcript_49796/g.60204 Transcript_49796/m.60204 type:complete len:90 (+) Transcript_49796:443-712(+)
MSGLAYYGIAQIKSRFHVQEGDRYWLMRVKMSLIAADLACTQNNIMNPETPMTRILMFSVCFMSLLTINIYMANLTNVMIKKYSAPNEI